MTTANLVNLTLAAYTRVGDSDLKEHLRTVEVAERDAPAVVQHFYDGTIYAVWDKVDAQTQQWITGLGIDPNAAVNGEVGVGLKTLSRYGKHLVA